ncbi:MAG: hypothetical protein FWD17_01695 [Polyangiaceae bacterium]|nr:hypothetical protein [Polyangiaceae bacterium]
MEFYSSTEPARISVDRAAYRPLERTLEGWPPGARAAVVVAGDVRALAFSPPLRVESCPEDGNEAHAEIRASADVSKNFIRTKVCVQLAGISLVE